MKVNSKLPIDIINELALKIPSQVLFDIDKRITDWRVAGGKDDDVYMWQQARYAQNWSKYLETKDGL